jgi:hypothetical protein
MSDAMAARNAAKAAGPLTPSSAGDFNELPETSKFFCGISGDGNGSPGSPRHSIILNPQESQVLVILSAGDFEPKFYTTSPTISDAIRDLEKALSTGRGEWKRPKFVKDALGKAILNR